MSFISNKQACFICKRRFCRQRLRWRCVFCPIASHDKCTAWPDKVMHLIGQPRRAVCWRHPTDWRQERKVNFFFPSSVCFFDKPSLVLFGFYLLYTTSTEYFFNVKMPSTGYPHIRDDLFIILDISSMFSSFLVL